jgi:ABC-type sugar transport system permease subunit
VAILFVLPAGVVLFYFRLLPMVDAVTLSFTNWDGFTKPTFVGLDNYARAWSDPQLLRALRNNFLFVGAIPIWVGFPLILALALHDGLLGRRFFRLAFFVPVVLSTVFIGIYYKMLLGYNGPVNFALRSLGLDGLAREWLVDPKTALPIIIAVTIWSSFGIGVLIFLAALSSVDVDMQDAARLDGASNAQVHWYVTLPQLRPAVELWLVVVLIIAFTGVFPLIFSMTRGGPGYSTQVAEYRIYEQAFLSGRFGYASALGILLLLIVLAAVLLVLAVLRRRNQE